MPLAGKIAVYHDSLILGFQVSSIIVIIHFCVYLAWSLEFDEHLRSIWLRRFMRNNNSLESVPPAQNVVLGGYVESWWWPCRPVHAQRSRSALPVPSGSSHSRAGPDVTLLLTGSLIRVMVTTLCYQGICAAACCTISIQRALTHCEIRV